MHFIIFYLIFIYCSHQIYFIFFRLIEQTEFVDDETFEPFEGSSNDYPKRATKIKLDSPDKLMYICRVSFNLIYRNFCD